MTSGSLFIATDIIYVSNNVFSAYSSAGILDMDEVFLIIRQLYQGDFFEILTKDGIRHVPKHYVSTRAVML